MNSAPLLYSLIAVLAIAAAAWALRLGGASFADEAQAMAEAEGQLPGFHAATARLTESGAEVTSEDGRVMTLRKLGARWVGDL